MIEKEKKDIAKPSAWRRKVRGSPRYSVDWTAYYDYPDVSCAYLKYFEANDAKFLYISPDYRVCKRNRPRPPTICDGDQRRKKLSRK